MKKRSYFIIATFISAVALSISLSSCLKDPRYVDFAKVGTLVELPLAAFNGNNTLVAEALPIQDAAQIFPVVINVAAPKPLSSPLKVTLKLDVDSLARYNQKLVAQFTADSLAYENDTTGTVPKNGPLVQYGLPPADAFNIPNLSVTVPANQHTVNLPVTVITSKLSLTSHYIIPLTIVDASGQKISNYRSLLYNVQPKNQWDGVYALSGFMHRDLDMSLGGPIVSGVTIPMATAGSNALVFNQTWANGGGLAGLNPVTIVIDPSTNKVTSITSPIATIVSLPGYDNHYDPASKTFYLSIIWAGTDPAHRSTVDTLTYQGVRN